MITVYTVKEVAKILKVSERTTFQLLYDGKIKATKVGGRWRILEEDVLNFMRDNRETPTTKADKANTTTNTAEADTTADAATDDTTAENV